MKIALDATYSVGRNLSGIGVYSRELMRALAARQPDIDWRWLFRPHRLWRGLQDPRPSNVRASLLIDSAPARRAELFHGLNQRLPNTRFRHQVATFHDLFVLTSQYSTPEFRARFVAQANHAARQADRIIAVSQFTARQLVNLLGVQPERVRVVPHGVRMPPLPHIIRRNIVLHVGALQTRKNLVRLVRSFAALDDSWRLVLAGSDGYGAEEIHETIARSTARTRIQICGYVTASELIELYVSARIFAFPSLNEGFGMPVLEAMSTGVPVLCSNTSAVAEVAGDAALLVDPSNEEEIAAGLRALATNDALRDELVAKGRARASHFSWERAADATFAVYCELI